MLSILKISLRRRKLVIFLSLLLLGAGLYSYITIPKQEMPDMVVPMAVVQVVAPGLSANEMESITSELEKVFSSYDEIDYYTTLTLDNVIIGKLNYDFEVDDFNETSERIKSELLGLDFGDTVQSISFRTNFDIPHIVYALSGGDINKLESVAVELEATIMDFDNVKTTKITESIEPYISLKLNSESLQVISITDIYSLIKANSESIPLGMIEGNTLRIDGKFTSISELGSIFISYSQDPISLELYPIYLKDIAEIEIKEYEQKEFYHDGKRVIFLEVYFKEDIDFSILGKDLRENINSFVTDVEITEMNYIPDYVDEQISQAMISLLYCVLIVVVVVLIGLGVRNALSIAITIPIIAFATILTIDIMGYELQRVSIAGIVISIGILVDNSIVISEAIQHYLDAGVDVYKASKQAIKDNSIAVLASTLTTVAAFIPLTMLPGLPGQMAKSLPITVMTAIVISYIFAMIVTPVIATLLFKPRIRKKKKQKLLLSRVLRTVLKVPRLVLLTSVLSLILTGYLVYKNQPIDIFPADEKSEFYIDFKSNEGTSDSAKLLATDVIEVLDTYEGINRYYYSLGGNLPQFSSTTQPINELPNEGRFYVHTDLAFSDISDLLDELNNDFRFIDGDVNASQMTLGIASAPVEMSITSSDLQYLTSVSRSLEEMLSESSDVSSFVLNQTSISDTYRLRVNREALASNNVQLIELQSFIYSNLNGLKLDSFLLDDISTDIYIESTVDSIEELMLLNYNGVEISNFISVYLEESFGQIYKYNEKYQVSIEIIPMNIDKIELESNTKEFLSSFEVEIVTGGDTELANTIFGDIGTAAVLAVVLIYVIMFIQFNSFRKPLIVFLTIPLSLIGSFTMMLIFDTPISLTSLLGIVSLVGVVVNTGILLVEYITKAMANGLSKLDACIEAVGRRIRPILLASTTTVLGLIPLAINGGEFFRPLAIVFIGGIISSTFLTIFVVPSLYIILVDNKTP